MRAVGAGPATTVLDGLIGIGGSILVGAVLAAGLAVALSPLSPIGPARPVYPDPGFNADWTVLGFGVLALVIVLAGASVLIAFIGAPHRADRRRETMSRSATVELAARSGLPPSAVAGVRFAVDPGRGRSAVPTRSALLGAVIAMAVVAATLTFGSSLQTLVSRPALYGWNWDYAVQSSDGYGPVPNSSVTKTLAHSHEITAESGVWFGSLQLDGVEVPVLLANPGAAVTPPIISGHGLRAPDQVVLGAGTLAELHKSVGDTIEMQFLPNFPPKPIRLKVVGVATMPAIGIAEGLHTSMGIGAIVPTDNSMLTEREGPEAYPGCNGPNMVFLRVNGGVGSPAGERAAQQLAASANRVLAREPTAGPCGGNLATVLSVQRPAQIVDYRSMGTTPILLAVGLALGAIAALGLALTASVRRRRHDLALLKTLGFTQRQLAAAVAWQSTIAVVFGLVVGLPLGIALGRWLWTLFANEIGALAAPTVPVWSLVVVVAAAILLANLVAAFPGRSAGRTPTALMLHDE